MKTTFTAIIEENQPVGYYAPGCFITKQLAQKMSFKKITIIPPFQIKWEKRRYKISNPYQQTECILYVGFHKGGIIIGKNNWNVILIPIDKLFEENYIKNNWYFWSNKYKQRTIKKILKNYFKWMHRVNRSILLFYIEKYQKNKKNT